MAQDVLNLISGKQLVYNVSGHDYLIKCLNPEHNDKSPSLRVDKVTGAMHCFSCSFKGNLFSFYGIKNNLALVKVLRLKQKILDIQKCSTDIDFPYDVIPFFKEFRGISPKVYKTLGAFTTNTQNKLFSDRLYFPITNINGKVAAYLGRKVDGGTSKDKYYVYPSGTPLPPYPLIVNTQLNYVVLVEGIFDLANLMDKGMDNVVCIFGIDTLTKNADTSLLPIKAQGVGRVYVLLDGDLAGRQASKKLKPILEDIGFGVTILDLPDGKDPGDLDLEEVNKLKERIISAH